MKYSIPQSYYKTLLFKFEIQNGIGTFSFLKTLDCVRERVYDVISSMRFEHGMDMIMFMYLVLTE